MPNRSTLRHVAALLLALAAQLPRDAATQSYSGPPSNSTAYWDEPAFNDHPYRGPAAAIGALFWSHGLSGKNPQWHIAPPAIIKAFAGAGWDVIKVQRNNLHENGWSASGESHVADLLARVRAARGNGYRHVILAGQSYGGAISLEAGGRGEQILGVIAFAPGHGSDACASSAGTSSREISANLPGYLTEAIGRLRAPRIVLSVADGDECMGHQRPSARLEAALAASPARYIHFDDSMPIRNHHAALTSQFSAWYRDCLLAFMAPEQQPAQKRTVCPAPANTSYLLPANLALPPGSATNLQGLWSGTYASADTNADRDREFCLAVDARTPEGLKATAYYGAGPGRNISMSVLKLNAKADGGGFIHRGEEQFAIALTPRPAENAIDLAITSRNGKNRFSGRLRPGC